MPKAVSAAPRLLAVAVELGLVPPFIVASVAASLAFDRFGPVVKSSR